MIKNKKILVVGAGGFIGGHLVKRLLNDENFIIATDIKPKEYWFQDFEKTKNYYSMFLIWLVTWVEWVLLRIIKQSVCSLF